MEASFTWLCACECAASVRLHPEGGYGDPYVFAVTAVRDGGGVLLVGGSGRLPKGARAAIDKVLRDRGFTHCEWERLRRGRARRLKRQ